MESKPQETQEEKKVEEPQQEKKEEKKVEKQKHFNLAEEKKDVIDEIEIVDNKYIKNEMSPFINNDRDWDNKEDFTIPDDIKDNLINMGFKKPSRIQAATIPLISMAPYKNVIAQAAAGSGKTAAFAVGSILRIDRKDPKTQVLVVVNARELCNQIHAVYEKILKGTGITLANFASDDKRPQ
jgi:ATP-dependent RNA helicase DDX19/DBP5